MYIGNDLQIAHPSYKIIDDISSGFNGSTTSFALQVSGATPVPFPISTQQVMISVNGVVQEPDPSGSAGFKLLGSNIVFSSAPANGHAFFGVINAGADYVTAGSEFPDGSATAPSFTFQDDQDTGWFRSGSGAVGYSANGAQTLTFDGNGLTVTGDASFVGDSSKNLLWDKSDGQLEFADNAKAVFGTGSDLSVYHDGTDSVIHGGGGSAQLKLRAPETRITNEGNSETLARFIQNGAVELYYDNSKKFETTSSGAIVTGQLSADNLILGDNEKLYCGDGDDLQIYHSGGDNFIKQAVAGTSLRITQSNDDISAIFYDTSVALYYDNSKKFETTSGGITVTGTCTATSFAGDGSGLSGITSTTINNNADNRVITGSGTANTLNGESELTWDGQTLDANGGSNDTPLILDSTNSNGAHMRFRTNGGTQHFLGCGGGISLGDSQDLSIRAYDNVLFAAGNTATERFRFAASGQLGVGGANYGTSGQVLTSGGASAAPSWTTISAAPTITATASGTIAANASVIVNSDATVSAVSEDAEVTGSIVAESSANGGSSSMAYDTANDKVVHIYVYNNKMYGRVGTTNANGSLSWGSQVNVWTGSGTAGYPDIAFASDTGVFYLFYRRWTGNDSRGYVTKITVSGTSFSTAQTTQVVPQDGPEHGCIALDNNGGGMIVWKSNISGENNRLKANLLTFGSGASSISAGSRQEVNSGNTANYPSIAYDSANDNYCICWENNSMSGRFTVIKATRPSGASSTITFQGTNNINSVLSRETQVLNIAAGKFLGLYARKGSDDIRGTIITMNADNTISFSSATTIYTTAGSGDVNMMNNNCLVKVDYLTDTYAVLMMDYGSSSKGVLQFFTASGSTITPTDTIQLWPNGLNNPALLYDPDNKLLVTAGRDANNSYYISSRIYRKAQSNADTGNFVGFSSAGYSNGNTATINVEGNTVTGLSGLTVGKKYYVQSNGTLGTTSTSIVAGISLSASKLLIKS